MKSQNLKGTEFSNHATTVLNEHPALDCTTVGNSKKSESTNRSPSTGIKKKFLSKSSEANYIKHLSEHNVNLVLNPMDNINEHDTLAPLYRVDDISQENKNINNIPIENHEDHTER